jgi:hypothetical protein
MPWDYARSVVQCKLIDTVGSQAELILGVAIFSELSDDFVRNGSFRPLQHLPSIKIIHSR